MMSQLRNKAFRKYLCLLAVGVVFAALVSVFTHIALGIVVGIIWIGFVIANYENKRHQNIMSLTMYLKRLNYLDYDYELRDFDEGDFSLLKSEIHKTMYLLQNYNMELSDQKEFIYTALSDISHQLKTPVAGLQLMLDLMDSDTEQMEHMQTQVSRLQSLVERLLTHIQLEARSIHLQQQPVSAPALVDALRALVSTDIEIVSDVQEYNLIIDQKWTLDALFNVLHNKLRYANTKIMIKGYASKLHYTLDIFDDGLAVDTKDRERLFTRFYKGVNSDSSSVGIGLAITKEIMELQGGKVMIVDDNTFRFVFYDKTVTS